MTADAPAANDDITDWLAVYYAPGVGATTFHALLAHFATPAAVRTAPTDELRGCGLGTDTVRALRDPDRQQLARDLDWLSRPGNHLLTCNSPHYPALLRQVADPPPILYVHGDPGLLNAAQLAIVGSRNPTPSGSRTAQEFASHLAAAGLVITSGLALGIDTAAHRGAAEPGLPTIAVMGTGLDRVYPASNRGLAREIARHGALVSEFPIGTPPLAENFPRRNRIISGLSLGTLVVEAALRSGSLISARLAAEQGREVFAIPGSIHNPLARGCHRLIREGAKLVETAQDIIDELGPLASVDLQAGATARAEPRDSWQPDAEYMQLLDFMGFDNISVDRLVERSGLTPAAVSSMLLQLELSGHIASSPGGIYNRLK
jgi:DNA processing protein